MLFLDRETVEALLNLDQLVDALAGAMAELSAGSVSMPPRVAASVEQQNGLLGVMPVYLASSQTLAAKLVSIFPQNAALNVPTHQAIIAVFDALTGSCLAIMDGTYITAARTAAGSALATRLLARADADILAVIGAGVQARMHALMIPRVRPIQEIRIVGRTPEKAQSLAQQLSQELGIVAKAVGSFSEAAAGAGVICAATHATHPVVLGEHLAPGVHVNSVGFNPEGREVDDVAIVKSLVVVESRRSALAPPPAGSNELMSAIRNGWIAEGHIHAEVGELVSGKRPGRTSCEQITLYKSVGVAVQDAVAANLVLKTAREKRAGLEVAI